MSDVMAASLDIGVALQTSCAPSCPEIRCECLSVQTIADKVSVEPGRGTPPPESEPR